jgi:hypothetical protein
MRSRIASCILLLAFLALGAPAWADNNATVAREATRTRAAESFGKLPLYFVENRGQLDSRVAYYVQGSDKAIYFTNDGLTFALPGWALKLDFVGARADARPEGQEPTEATFSYFKGRPSQWQAGLKTYSEIVYRDLWPGIDLVYAGTVHRMKYTFRVKPGADPDQIKLAWRGAPGVELNAAGELAVTTPRGGFTDERPVSWQVADGRQVEVATKYRLAANHKTLKASSAGAAQAAVAYGFEVGDYDRSRELVIDPAVLVYAGFLGGSGNDSGTGIAVDSAGNAYVTGSTDSNGTFPVTVGPDPTFNGGFSDAFVAKVNAAGTALVYAGFLGGSGDDSGSGIAVDGAGRAYVTGNTQSDETSFPVTVGPDLTFNGVIDAFVARVNAAGTALEYCGYIGGATSDKGNAIAVDSAGNAYVTGLTGSNEASFPVTVGPDLTFHGGGDAFVAKVNASGTALLYAGYIGGTGEDEGTSIAVDGAGNAYVTGFTESDETSFPVTVGPDLTFNGTRDGFVAKVNASGTALGYCGYIGGSGFDSGSGIAVDSAGNAYVTGVTESDETSFPVTAGPDLTFNGGFLDAFVAKVNAAGTALVYAGYIGGSDLDFGIGIAVDGAGNAYVTGTTASDQTSFPVTSGPDLTFNGSQDAFVAKIAANGTALTYAGYIGGSGNDVGRGIAVDSAGNAYVTGDTDSDQTSFPVTSGPDLTFNGGTDAFVAKISVSPQDQIGDLIAQINALVAGGQLAANKAKPLITKLENVAGKLGGSQTGAACNQLDAFINQVNAYISNGTLTPAQGQALIHGAEALQISIPCRQACPCVGIAAFDNILANLNLCNDEGDRVTVSTNGFLADLAFANSEALICGYNISHPPSSKVLSITPVQALACLDAVRAAAAQRGVTCTGPF